MTDKLMNIKDASIWATNYIGKNVTTANISYLIQYGRVKKIGENGFTQVAQDDLINYYQAYNGAREVNYKERLGDDLNWNLSFDQYKEAETTKHVHRLHPYKGMNAVGIDVSAFNALIGNCKVATYDIYDLQNEITRITKELDGFIKNSKAVEFEDIKIAV
jgi:hypothetical protein